MVLEGSTANPRNYPQGAQRTFYPYLGGPCSLLHSLNDMITLYSLNGDGDGDGDGDDDSGGDGLGVISGNTHGCL